MTTMSAIGTLARCRIAHPPPTGEFYQLPSTMVLPTSGPPVMTKTRLAGACLSTSRWPGASSLPGPGLAPVGGFVYIDGRVRVKLEAVAEALQDMRLLAEDLRHPKKLLACGPKGSGRSISR
jgi:hypothetical protein